MRIDSTIFAPLSDEYFDKLEQNRQLHYRGKAHPGRTRRYYHLLRQIVIDTGSKTLLDWGCGKGQQWKLPITHIEGSPMLKEYLELTQVTCYDPGVAEYNIFPSTDKHDLVICTDVLSLIPEQDLSWVFAQLRIRCSRALFLVVQSDQGPSNKRYADGTPKQVTVKSREWWINKCWESADWTGITVYWKWCEDGRVKDEVLVPYYNIPI